MRVDLSKMKCDECGSTEAHIIAIPKQTRSSYGKARYVAFAVITCAKCGAPYNCKEDECDGRK